LMFERMPFLHANSNILKLTSMYFIQYYAG
jgi:hypothetical protein